MSDTHRKCKELLEQNGFSVSQSLVPCLRNAFDITKRQQINPVQSQSGYYRLQKLELHFVLQMEWCITRHNRAQYIETTLQYIEINVFNLLRCKVERVLEAVSGFTNPFSSSFEDNDVYFLSFGVPAKPGIVKGLIEADDIGRKAVADFIDSLLVEHLSFTTP